MIKYFNKNKNFFAQKTKQNNKKSTIYFWLLILVNKLFFFKILQFCQFYFRIIHYDQTYYYYTFNLNTITKLNYNI